MDHLSDEPDFDLVYPYDETTENMAYYVVPDLPASTTPSPDIGHLDPYWGHQPEMAPFMFAPQDPQYLPAVYQPLGPPVDVASHVDHVPRVGMAPPVGIAQAIMAPPVGIAPQAVMPPQAVMAPLGPPVDVASHIGIAPQAVMAPPIGMAQAGMAPQVDMAPPVDMASQVHIAPPAEMAAQVDIVPPADMDPEFDMASYVNITHIDLAGQVDFATHDMVPLIPPTPAFVGMVPPPSAAAATGYLPLPHSLPVRASRSAIRRRRPSPSASHPSRTSPLVLLMDPPRAARSKLGLSAAAFDEFKRIARKAAREYRIMNPKSEWADHEIEWESLPVHEIKSVTGLFHEKLTEERPLAFPPAGPLFDSGIENRMYRIRRTWQADQVSKSCAVVGTIIGRVYHDQPPSSNAGQAGVIHPTPSSHVPRLPQEPPHLPVTHRWEPVMGPRDVQNGEQVHPGDATWEMVPITPPPTPRL